MLVRSIVLYVSKSEGEEFIPGRTAADALGGHIDLVPAQFIWLIGLAIVAAVVMNSHRLGNRLFAVGGNLGAARNIGVPVARVKTIAFVISGTAAAAAGVFSAVRTQSVSPIEGQGLELQAIAACVIGGVALTGGRGSVLGIFLGASLIYTVQQILLLAGAPGYYLDGFVAVVIVAAVVLNRALQRHD
jgi:simple sugar transport system permease protein